MTAIVATVGAVALTLSQFTSAVDTITGGATRAIHVFRPEPSPTPTPPADLSATVGDVQLVERDKVLADVYRDRGLTPDPTRYAPQQLATPGQLFRFHCTFGGGFLGRDVGVRWTLYDADQQQVVRGDPWKTVDAVGWPSPGWTVQATNIDLADGELWVPNVRAGQFKVLIHVVDDREGEVVSAWSEPFTVAT